MIISRTMIKNAIIFWVISMTTSSQYGDKGIKKYESECIKDENCSYMSICQDAKCVHKPFVHPNTEEIIGGFAIIIGSAVSNAGGIGGGGLLIPILIIILRFSTKEAIPISKLMIFTGALTAFLMGLKNKHPHRNGIPLDINIAGVLVPMLLFGTMVGVSLNKVMPPSIILISLTFVLVVNTFKTTKKGLKLFNKENEVLQHTRESGDTEECENLKTRINDISVRTDISKYEGDSCNKFKESFDKDSTTYTDETNTVFIKDENQTLSDCQSIVTHQEIDLENYKLNELLQRELERDKISFPRDKMWLIGISFILLIMVSLLKGSDHFDSLIKVKPCSSPYWILYFLYLPVAISITYHCAEKVYKEYNHRIKINYPFHETDVKWTVGILIGYPIYAFFGGAMAGLLGIGGGLIFGPLLLDLGLNPIVSTATSNFLVLFTSFSTSLQFILIGTMNFHYGIVCTVCSTVGSYFGTVGIQKIIDKTGRASVLIFAMAIVESISSVCIPLHTFYEIKRDIGHGRDIWSFSSPC